MIAEKVVRKHVAIIHAYSMMSVMQRKIVNVLLYEAHHAADKHSASDSVAVECRMPISALSKEIQFKSNNIQYLKESIDGLASLKIEWNLLKDRVPTNISFLNLRVLQGSPTFYNDGIFNFSFHKVMLELLKSPQIYGTIDLGVQSQFESKYGHALYENASRLVNLQKEKVIELDLFKKLFCVQENKYESMRELTRNVISPAIEEVNDLAGFTVDAENIKSNNKVIAFKLHVKDKKKITKFHLKKEYDNERGKALEAINLAFGNINYQILDNILKNYTDDYILEKITYTKSHAKKEHTNLYPMAYFISALKNDYQSSDKSKITEEKKQKIENPLLDWNRKKRELEIDLLTWT
ncbi:MAG: initiator RepB protein, partial [Legionellales bacterium RIFCSPHIGHO2_12_FULL_35_11]